MPKAKLIILPLLVGLVFIGAQGAAPGGQIGFRTGGGLSGWAMLGAAALISLMSGLYLARRQKSRASTAQASAPEPDTSVTAARLARLTEAARTSASTSAANLDPSGDPQSAEPDHAVGLACSRPIVFRQSFPPASDQGRSFYGGKPIGPATLEWPRHAADQGAAPLSFVMQWDCRELAAQDATGLLPREGVLYFFADLTWRSAEAFRFVHTTGDPASWTAIEPPADLPPLFGEETAWQVPWCSQRVPRELQDCPVVLPRWPFRPIAFDYPDTAGDEPEDGLFWAEDATGEALVAVQESLGAPLARFDPDRQPSAPFPAFPHDWAAVRIVSSMVIDHLHRPQGRLPKALKELDEEARNAMIAEWRDEAIELYQFAASHPLNGAIPADLSGQIRAWMDKVDGCFSYGQAVDKAVNASLGLDSAALDAIPPEAVARASLSHMLGLAYERSEYRHEFIARCCTGIDPETGNARWAEAEAAGTLPRLRTVHAPSPNRMFGPPSYVQGGAEELVGDHLLLLEISSSSPIGIELGEGVIQYMIRPADLAAGQFDRAVAVMSAY